MDAELFENYEVKIGKPWFWPIVYFFDRIPFESISAFTFGRTIYAPQSMKKYILEHEKVHVRQQKNWLRAIWLGILYRTSKKHRLQFEVEAYRASLKYGGPKEWCASALTSPIYGRISYEEALKLLCA